MNHLPISSEGFIKTLHDNPDLPVVFTLGKTQIKPGYHITEVKQAAINSLDCGQGSEQWRELVIELLDGSTSANNTYMLSNTMLSILKKAQLSEADEIGAKLYFEFAPKNETVLKLSVDAIEVIDDVVTVSLVGSTAQCKPYQRALKSGVPSATSGACCNSAPSNDSTLACCGTENAKSSVSGCCA